jgi:tetratricopeptide (TPR) repeat protein
MSPTTRYQKGDKIGGRYLVHRALAGGMGEVYLCLDTQQNLPYALKTFQARHLANPRLRGLFEREVGIWVALEKHPNLVRCFYMDTLDNQPFMVLEWVAAEEGYGTDLRDLLLRRGRLDPRLALDFAIDVCRGMAHAADRCPGVVHCDLKPENVLVAQGRLAKVTDLGLAKVAREAGLTPDQGTAPSAGRRLVSAAGGTPPYMAPEQWRGEPVDPRTDVYAVGCLLYELLTGRLPFDAPTEEGLRRQHLGSPPPALALVDAVCGALGGVLGRCLAKEAKERYASAAELRRDLAQVYEGRWGQPPRPVPRARDFTAGDYTNRGFTYEQLGRHAEALADYATALRLDPNHAQAYYNRGNIYIGLGRLAEALADYAAALRLDPTRAQAYYNRGNTYYRLGRHAEALADYAAALRLDPNDAQAYCNRGATYVALGRPEEALEDYGAALRLDPNYAHAYCNRGVLYANRGELQAALCDFEQAERRGHSAGAQYAAHARQTLGQAPPAPADPAQEALAAFLAANSAEAIRRACMQFPLLVRPDVIVFIEQTVCLDCPAQMRPFFEQRLTWLRQLAAEQRRR